VFVLGKLIFFFCVALKFCYFWVFLAHVNLFFCTYYFCVFECVNIFVFLKVQCRLSNWNFVF
jgi:hypothetical protein